MPKRLRSNRGLSAQEAHQALSVLIHDGKIEAAEVWRALERRERLLNDLKGRLAALGGDFKSFVAKDGPFPMGPKGKEIQRSRRNISRARRAALSLQGKYLGAIRQLSKANRAEVRSIRKKSGVRKAIAAAKGMPT